MAKNDKKEVLILDDEKAQRALEDALLSNAFVKVSKIEQLEKFRKGILALHAKGVSTENIKKVIDESGSGHTFALDMIRKFIAQNTVKPVQAVPAAVVAPKSAPAPAVAAPVAQTVLAAGVKK
ncbi:hypothetical protein ACXZ1M_24315 [Duganella sp. PWIR1]